MTGSSPLLLGLLCLAVAQRAAVARLDGTSTSSGPGTAAELMEEIRARMSTQWDTLQHIRYQALTSKMTVGRLSERVKQLVAAIASRGEPPPPRTAKATDLPVDLQKPRR